MSIIKSVSFKDDVFMRLYQESQDKGKSLSKIVDIRLRQSFDMPDSIIQKKEILNESPDNKFITEEVVDTEDDNKEAENTVEGDEIL